MGKIIVIGLIALIIGVIIVYITYKDDIKYKNDIEYKEMSFIEMEDLIEKDVDYVIIDVRTKEEYETGKVLDAINIPLNEIDKVKDIIKDKNKYIFVYCRSGNRSTYAANELNKMGFFNVYNVGGIINYQKSN